MTGLDTFKDKKKLRIPIIGFLLVFLGILVAYSATHSRRPELPARPNLKAHAASFTSAIESSEKEVTRLFAEDQAWTELGILYLANGFFSESKVAFENRLLLEKEDPGAAPQYYLGYIAQQLGDLEEAIRKFREVVEFRPENTSALMRLADSLAAEGNLIAAEKSYRRLLEIDSTHDFAIVELARILSIAGKEKEARHLVFESLKTNPSSINLTRSAIRFMEKAGDSERAAEFRNRVKNKYAVPVKDPLIDILATKCFDTQTLSLYFEDALKTRRIEDAFFILDRIEKVDPKSHKAFYLRGYAFSEIGKNEDAIRNFEKSLRLGAQPEIIYPPLSICYINSDQYERAEDVAIKGLSLDPRSSTLRLSLAKSRFELGKQNLAIQDFEHVLKRDPKNTEAMRRLAQIHGEMGESNTALLYLEKLANESKNDLISRALLGQKHLEKGDFRSAIKWLREAYELDRTNERVLDLLSLAYIRTGNMAASENANELAFSQYENAIKISPRKIEAYVNAARLHMKVGNEKPSEAMFKRLITANPQEPMGFLLLGDFYKYQGKSIKAVESWSAAKELAKKYGHSKLLNSSELRLTAEAQFQ